MKRYIGIDTHSLVCKFVIIDAEGKTITSGDLKSDQKEIIQFIERNKVGVEDSIGMEACAYSIRIARCFRENSLAIIDLYKAEEARKYATKTKRKNDRLDALCIADAMRTDKFGRPVYIPPPVVEELRFLISRRARIVRARTAVINSAKFIINKQIKDATKAKKNSFSYKKGWLIALAQESLTDNERNELTWEYEEWQRLNEHEKTLDKQINALIEKHFKEEYRLLRTIPGIGPVTAAAMIGAIGDISRFETPEQLVSYFGLDPGVWDSGKTESKGKPITKNGNKYIRSLLVECAQKHSKPWQLLYPYYTKGTANGAHKKGIINVAHKLVRIAWAVLRKRKEFDPAYLNVKETVTRPMVKYKLNKD